MCVLPGCLQGLQTPWMSHGKQLELLSWTFPICPSGSHLEHGCFSLGPVSTDTSKRLETGGESSGYPPPQLVPCQTGLGSSCFPLMKASPAADSCVPELQLLPVSATCPIPCLFRPRWRRLPLRLPLIVSPRLVRLPLTLPSFLVFGFLLPMALLPATDASSCFHLPKTNS